MADHLAIYSAMVFFCVCFVTLQYDVPGQVWYLIVSIPDLNFLLYEYVYVLSIKPRYIAIFYSNNTLTSLILLV